MAFDLHLAPDPGDLAGFVDQEGRALDAHVGASVHALFDPDAVGSAGRLVLVGGQGHLQLMLGLELVVLGGAVGGHADDRRVGAIELGFVGGEVDGFAGAAGRVVLGVEIQHHFLAFQILQPDVAAAVAWQAEIRCFVSHIDGGGHAHIPSRRFHNDGGCDKVSNTGGESMYKSRWSPCSKGNCR